MRLRASEAEEAAGERAPARPEPAPPAAALLRLQASAGNVATARMLARIARAPVEQRALPDHTLEVAGIGTFLARSFTKSGSTSLSAMFDAGRDAPRLMEAAAQARPIPTVVLHSSGGHKITLTDVVVMSASQSAAPDGVMISAEFNGTTLVFE